MKYVTGYITQKYPRKGEVLTKVLKILCLHREEGELRLFINFV